MLAAIVASTACSGAAPAPRDSAADAGATPRGRQTLNAVMSIEPVSLAAKPFQSTGISIAFATRLFNAQLDLMDARANPQPYLAESLPKLNSDTWRVFPDGRMETTYTLRPNLTWHDGKPLTAEDFVFAWQVYAAPGLGQSDQLPQSLMEEVAAPDPRTVVFRWKRLYPDAEAMGVTFQALPRHVLSAAFESGASDALVNHAFWSNDYVGLGPYRLERWEPGAFFEAAAFDGHVLGRPRIDRVVVRFASDENTALANLLSDSVQIAVDRSLRFEQGSLLKQEWVKSGKGHVILTPIQARFLHIQLRPEYVNPRALTDVWVRKALAHGVDKQALNEGLFGGEGVMSNTFIAPFLPYYDDVERAIQKYPYDVRRTEQYMTEAGFVRGANAMFVGANGESFAPDFLGATGGQQAKELAILAETWQRAGIDVQPRVLPAALHRDGQTRSTFPSIYGASQSGEEKNLGSWATAGIGTAANRWQGSNRGGWSNPDYDRMYEAFNSNLDRRERNQLAIDMMRLVSEELPILVLFHTIDVTAHTAALAGPPPNGIDAYIHSNVHEWVLR
jgi:peptide/nickel transport system substrate-binding protein